jgi:hypothetical protein
LALPVAAAIRRRRSRGRARIPSQDTRMG